MPIKIPKGFPRRKSTGNALDDLDEKDGLGYVPAPAPPMADPSTEQGSFRVIPRKQAAAQIPAPRKPKMEKASTWLTFGSPGSKGRDLDDDSSLNNRGSNGSSAANSALSKVYDTSSSSARLSSSSTLPSQDDELFPRSSTHHTLPAKHPNSAHSAEPKSFIQSARTWTLGGRSKPPQIHAIPPVPEHASRESLNRPRDRAVTTTTTSSYASTTIPPQLDSALPDSDFGSDLSDMLETLTKRKSALLLDTPKGVPSESEPVLSAHSKFLSPDRAAFSPSPLNSRRSNDNASSPLSYNSQDSHDGLMIRERSTSPYDEFPKSPDGGAYRSTVETSGTRKSGTSESRSSSRRSSLSFAPGGGDSDAQIVYNSFRSSRVLSKMDTVDGAHEHDESDMFGTPSSTKTATRKDQPIPQIRTVPDEDSLFNSATAAAIQYSDEKAYAKVQSEQSKKVMTAAQFERYKKHTSLMPPVDDARSDSDASETYDEVDELERSRQAAQHRRRQEAQLAVFRQQMQKTTGEQGAPTRPLSQFRPSLDRTSMSSPNLGSGSFLAPSSQLPRTHSDLGNIGGGNGSPPDGSDEDDDVPLAISMAHGFPRKNRPPSKMIGGGTSIVGVPQDRRTSTIGAIPRPQSASGLPSGGGANRMSTLPVFARNLPAEPFSGPSGAGANRLSTYDPNATLPGYQPGGLVGVIDQEERTRALRRGSPNAQMNASQPLPPNMPQPPMIGGMPPNPMMDPNMMSQMMANPNINQAQMQMFIDAMNRSNEMMAMMMAAMQQNQAMAQGMPPPANGFLSPHAHPTNPNLHRPPSFVSTAGHGPQPPHAANPYARTMSMVNPPQNLWGAPPGARQSYAASVSTSFLPSSGGRPGAPGYAGSIAPSERSTVGMASRYRPVSGMPADPLDLPRARTSTLLHLEGRHPADQPGGLAPSPSPAPHGAPRKSGVFATIRALGSKGARKERDAVSVVEEEDEEGWADVRRRKAKKERSGSAEGRERGSDVPEELRGLYVDVN